MKNESSPPPSSRKIAFGATALGASSILKMFLQMLALPLMARLLGPVEFGLYATAIPVVAFVGMLADGGLGASLVKEPESSPVWSTAFWALLGIGIVLAVTLTGAGFGLGAALGEPRLVPIMAALSLTIPLITLTVAPVARLDRQGRIAVGAGADLIGNIIGTCAGILLAFRHAGAWSLVGQYVTTFFIRTLIVNCMAFKMPRFEFQLAGLASHFAAGGFIVGVRLSDFAGRIAENLMIGRMLGTAAVGLYGFSNQAARFASESVSSPLWLSLYIRALREEKSVVIALHRQFSRLLGMILFPATTLFLVTAPALIPLCLGAKWLHATLLLQILLPGYVLNVIATQNGALLLAYNRYDFQLCCTAGLSIGKVLAVCLGPWIGLTGIACGVTGVNAIYAIVLFMGPSRLTGCKPLPVLRGLLGPAAASVFAGALGWAFLHYHSDTITSLAFSLVIGLAAYVASIILLDRKRVSLDLAILRNMLGRGGTSAAT